MNPVKLNFKMKTTVFSDFLMFISGFGNTDTIFYKLWENILQLKILLQLALPQNLATKIFKIYLQGKNISHPLFRAHMLVNIS